MRISNRLVLLAAGAACTLIPLAAAAQTPAHDAYYASHIRRLLGGADLDAVIGAMESGTHDVVPIPACAAVIPPGGIPGVTSQSFYYLTEILPPGIGLADPACGAWLGCFLDQVPGTVHDLATLVIDRECRVERTLVIPNRYVLAGVGMDGQGRLLFDLPTSGRALRFAPTPITAPVAIRHSQIRDLSIGSIACCGQTGIDLSNSTHVDIEKIRLSGFAFGIAGRQSFVNTIAGSNLSNNGFAIVPGFDTTTWQIRENSISFSGLAGIAFDSTTRASVVSGGVLESNPVTAIFLRGINNTVQTNWFEGNGGASGGFAIQVSAPALDSRILNNLFSSNDILDPSVSTLRCYNSNAGFGVLLADNCP